MTQQSRTTTTKADTQRAGAYRPSQKAALERIETGRKAAGLTVAELAAAADISERSYYGQLRAGRAFPRVVQALTMALRTLNKAGTSSGEWFP